MAADTWIGKRLPRPDADAQATGAALYPTEICSKNKSCNPIMGLCLSVLS